MASARTNFTVGIFLLVGIALIVASVVYFGLAGYRDKGLFYVAYFDESVQGLSKDSPVKYRGVTIGRVDNITVAPDATLIQATLKIESQIRPDENMVAQLKSVGITGIMFVELDQKEPADIYKTPRITFPTKHTVIPTKPSDIKHLLGSINDIVDTIKGLDLNGISNTALTVLASIENVVTQLDTQSISEEVLVALDNWNNTLGVIKDAGSTFQTLTQQLQGSATVLDRTVSHLDDIMVENREDLRSAVQEVNRTLEGSTQLMGEGQQFFVNTRQQLLQIEKRLQSLLRNLNVASKTLSESLESISSQPTRLIFSSPLPARTLQPAEGK